MIVKDWKQADAELREKTESWMSVVDDFNKAAFDSLTSPTLFERIGKLQREHNRLMDRMLSTKMIGDPMNTFQTMFVYEIFAVYAENKDMPLIIRPKVAYVGAFDDEEAKLKSGIYRVIDATKKEPTTEPLDPRWITVVCRRIAEISKFNTGE